MELNSLYQTAYDILNKSTPLRFDCGKLCRGVCCQNLADDIEAGENSGMYLFPGEEIMLQKAVFLDVIPVHFKFNTSTQILLATCNGMCVRNLRPLACRIFPLTPYLTQKDILVIRIDPRAIPICPLAEALDHSKLHPDFVEKVRKVFRMLITDPQIKSYIAGLSRLIDEFTNYPIY